jgi:hypothetical protein
MQALADKFHFIKYVETQVADFGISKETFDKLFAKVFLEIFEKEKHYPCIFEQHKTSIIKQLLDDLKSIKKGNKIQILLLLEDYQKLNSELSEMLVRVKKECLAEGKKCSPNTCNFDISTFPVFKSVVELKTLKLFKPELVTSPQFLSFFQEQVGNHGLFFLYNLNKDLLFIGKSLNLGTSILEAIADKNVEGYVAVALTQSHSDVYVYEPYYIIKEKPLLNTDINDDDKLTITLKPLKKSELIKIYENN